MNLWHKLGHKLMLIIGGVTSSGGGGSGQGFSELETGSGVFGAFSSFTQISVAFAGSFSVPPAILVTTTDSSGTPTYASIFLPSITTAGFDVLIAGGIGPSSGGTFEWMAYIP